MKIIIYISENNELLKKEFDEMVFINNFPLCYPELRVHPKILWEILDANFMRNKRINDEVGEDETLCIFTHSSDVLTFFGYKILKGELTCKEVKIITLAEDNFKIAGYSEDGKIIGNYKQGFFIPPMEF